MNLVEPGIRHGNPDDRRIAVLVADPPQRLVDRVEHHVADPRILQQGNLPAGVDIDLDEVAKGVIVLGIIGFASRRVERQAGHLVEHHPLDLGQFGQRAGGHVHPTDEPDLPGKAERRDQAVGPGIDEPARNRSERLGRQMRNLAQREGGELGQLRGLVGALPRDPLVPRVVELHPEHLVELARVEGLAALVAAEPLDELVGPLRQRQPADEARPVEIVVDPDLEIDRGAFALEPQRRVEFVMVADLGAERHFVIGALRAAEAPRHPGFEKHRRAFEVPARDVVPGGGEEIVEDRFGMLLNRHRLAVQETPPEGVLAVPHIHRRDMRQLMVDQREKALARGKRLHRLRQRRDVEQDGVVGRRSRRGIAVIAEVLEQHRGSIPRLPSEPFLMRGERIFERPRNVRGEVGLDRVEIEERQVLGLERGQVEPGRARRDMLGFLLGRLLGRIPARRLRRGRLVGHRGPKLLDRGRLRWRGQRLGLRLGGDSRSGDTA